MLMSDRDGWIWYDGKFVPWREATTHVLTHTLHYGAGVFEGVRAYKTDQGTAIFRLHDHTERLFNSAKIIGMPMPFSPEEINQAQIDVINKNELTYGYMRPMCFYGSEGMGLRADNLKTHCIVAAWEWGSYLGDENMKNGIKVKTSSYSRHHVNVAMCKAKLNGNYVNSMLALNEALHDGYDEALLLDVDGFVAEGSGENVFFVKKGKLYTPELTSALDGITRKTIISLADVIGIPVIEKRITRDEMYTADEAFFTGTAAEVTPIRELDNRMIGEGVRGEITTKLQSMYFDSVYGRHNYEDSWLSYTTLLA
ncbi:MAG: branched-chain amino acid transaminase [Gammaproteobacteria bacterium]|nr:branched-chain amino acid transaminase [Gammaproteobacteria bacterium]NNC68099.1 branched-chain amino acid transaminase [Gammaproteobacteria bacterium]